MANHKSAAKRARQTEKRTVRNRMVKGHVKAAVRQFREALARGDSDKARETMAKATRELRKAASKGVLHKRNVSRRVARLTKLYHKTIAAPQS